MKSSHCKFLHLAPRELDILGPSYPFLNAAVVDLSPKQTLGALRKTRVRIAHRPGQDCVERFRKILDKLSGTAEFRSLPYPVLVSSMQGISYANILFDLSK